MIKRVRLDPKIKAKSNSVTSAPASRLRLFGLLPQILEGEDGAAYDELLARICAAVKPVPASAATSEARVRRIILSSRHLGAHGLGYNTRSLSQLSRRLTPADIPALISLLVDRDLTVGIQFALASQCEAAILPVQGAAIQHQMNFLDASDTLNLISEFAGCTPEAQKQALEIRADLEKLRQEEPAAAEREAKRKTDDEARIQRNGLKMKDPTQAAQLTRAEREEVYHRSLKAMGLSEDGPMTPEQKQLVDRMYRSMVLGEVKTPPN